MRRHEAVLEAIQTIVGNADYAVGDDDGQARPPTHGDIAVLSRTRDYGRELLDVADEYGIPMAYDGGIELYRTDSAKLLLAWLRILESDSERGWAVVLEQAGYTIDEIDHVLKTEAYPADLRKFREQLQSLSAIGAQARRVFDRYGLTDEVTDALLHTIHSRYETTTITPGAVIQLIEAGIETGATVDVRRSAREDSVTVQTIHSAKGLEYPIVIMANMNEGAFPPTSRNDAVIQYRDPVGVISGRSTPRRGPTPTSTTTGDTTSSVGASVEITTRSGASSMSGSPGQRATSSSSVARRPTRFSRSCRSPSRASNPQSRPATRRP